MSQRRALVVHTRMPAFDRDSGSQDIDNTIRFLLRAGWRVTFLSREEAAATEERHAQRLRQMGVAAHAGFGNAERLLRSNEFDLALIAFWEPAAALLPLIHQHSPATRVVINSMDVHFLRNARRSFGRRASLTGAFGAEATDELNTYNAADAVIAVSDKERDLLTDFLGEDRVFTLPLAEDVERSNVPLEDRRGMYFVGNFRHLPNREAVEHLGAEILPLLDPELLRRHPLSVLGNWLDQVSLDLDPAAPGLRLVGWVPSMQPYMERSRLNVVPLLHGAGVKRKVIQSMMAGTPVVTTPVGAEGLALEQGTHALIGADPADLAAGITRLLTDDELWTDMAEAGAAHVASRHGVDLVERRFGEILDAVMGMGSGGGAPADAGHADPTTRAVHDRLQKLARPGDIVLMVSGGDDELVDLPAHHCWPFLEARFGGWAGFDPVDGPAAINHLEAQRARGAAYFVLPKPAFGWRHRYPELFEHLEARCQRVHRDEHLVVYDLGGRPDPAPVLDDVPPARVQVLGTYAAHRSGPHPELVDELGRSDRLVVEQRWRPDSAEPIDPEPDAEFVVTVRDDAIVPGGFLDALIATQATLDVDRLQPTHLNGPDGGPPVTERHLGTVAREVDGVTALPVLSVRGRQREGPTVLADHVNIGLRGSLPKRTSDPTTAGRVWVLDAQRRPEAVERAAPATEPKISVLIATYERPDLLRACLRSFADQTLQRDDFEVIVVDDGSETDELEVVLAEATSELQVVGLRIAHAGRSAAKNHAVLLARAPIVLFFDDDDRAEPDYLERHLAAHERHPADTVAILGHTDWAPELQRTPLMHFITDVDRLMFAYERLGDGQQLDWRGFWEGRISCKRALLLRHGLHDQRLEYSIDVEMAWRLSPAGLRVVYDASARSLMARPIDFPAFCARTEAKGRAQATIAALHPRSDMAARLHLGQARELWAQHADTEPARRARVAELEEQSQTDPTVLPALHEAYREVFRLLQAKGASRPTEEPAVVSGPPVTVPPIEGPPPLLVHDGSPAGAADEPLLSICIPVWSRTDALAEMAQRTIERVWEVAKVPTEVVVVDNGSPVEVPLAARVHRYDQNRGVSTGWNTGIRLARADTLVVLNSDCQVDPGWDEALYAAVHDGRRIAFPFTDHCDGKGFTRPDQGGTAGWCFMLTRATYEEVGPFDEWFSPAFCEDTDYWHRAWQLGIELSPVPSARVVHARRTSSEGRHDLLLQAHRYKYGWKHGVDPDRAPPYYNRDIEDYTAGRP